MCLVSSLDPVRNQKRSKSHVLIVEDDPDILAVEADIVRMVGLEPICASNGRAAIDCLEKHPYPCLVLLDLMMPEMSGPQFLAEIRRRGIEHLNVVVISCIDLAPDDRDSVVASLPKPFMVEQLEKILARWCSASSSEPRE